MSVQSQESQAEVKASQAEEDGYMIGVIVDKIDEKRWHLFLQKKLQFTEEEILDDEESFRTKSKLQAIKKWRGKNPENAVSRLRSLAKEFMEDVYRREEKVVISTFERKEDPVWPSRQVLDRGKFAYPRKCGKGCALIISNSFKGKGRKERSEAAKQDQWMMEHLWKKTLGCDLYPDNVCFMDQKAEQMKNLLKDMASLDAHENKYDYVVIVISTHGGLKREDDMLKIEKGAIQPTSLPEDNGQARSASQRVILGRKENVQEEVVDGNEQVKAKADEEVPEGQAVPVLFGEDLVPIRESEIMKYFYNNVAKGLHDIPKFFILDYCRGPETSSGVIRNKSTGHETGSIVNDDDDGRDLPSLLPALSDILVAYATHPRSVALEQGRNGSWLISRVAKIFEGNYDVMDAVSMLTMVNAKIKDLVGNADEEHEGSFKRKAMSTFQSSLVKRLWF